MKAMKNSYSSVKTVSSIVSAVSLTPEQSEALWQAAAALHFNGDLEVTLGEVTIVLKLRGRADAEACVSQELFQSKVELSEDMIWARSVQAFLREDWRDSESMLSYGELRHQMSQMARGYFSKAKSSKGVEKVAYIRIAKRLQEKDEVRKMLSFLGKMRDVLINTYETLRGQGGKIRIVHKAEEK